jgi:hypothetical protein
VPIAWLNEHGNVGIVNVDTNDINHVLSKRVKSGILILNQAVVINQHIVYIYVNTCMWYVGAIRL